MRLGRLAAIAGLAAGALLFSGCTAPQPEVIEGSSISVALDNPFYSYNPDTSYGDAPANAEIAYATNSGFNYYDDELNLVQDDSFGTYEKLSDDPLVVKYTIADGVTWSDGTAIDAADLLLAWAARSGAYNDKDFDPTEFTDPATGQFTDEYPSDAVFFDSGANPERPSGIGLARQLPQVSEDKKSITLVYDAPYVDWEVAFYGLTSPGLPAHVVAEHALGLDDPQEAKDALVAAITDDDRSALAKVSKFWNTGFNLTDMPADPDILVSSGPYTITDLVAGQYVVLTANENYTGSRRPTFEQIRVRFMTDPLAAVQALQNGEVQVISPQATSEVVDALGKLDFTVLSGNEATFEHLDLQFDESKSGYFADPNIRDAFLKTVPRQQIVDELVVPLQEDATTRDSLLLVPGADGYDEAVKANGSQAYAHVDIEGAKALLAQAGVPNPQVCILYAAANPRRASEFALIQQSAAQAGFLVTDCSSADWRGVLGTAGAYDAALFGWQAVSLGVTGNSSAFRTGGINNLTRYSNPDVDELLAKLDGTFDPDDQLDIVTQVDTLLWADHYGVPLYQFPAVTAYDQKAVANISPSTLAPTIFWNVWQWSPPAKSE